MIDNLPLYFYGNFPEELRWRASLWFVLLVLLSVMTLASSTKRINIKFLPIAWLLYTPIGIFLVVGGLGLKYISTSFLGGLLLTIFLTTTSLVCSLPLGILLAIGRNSKLPLFKSVSSIYIDFYSLI